MATASAAFTFDGAAGSLLKLSTTASATVTATIDSLDGVSTIAWSVASTDESMAPGDYTLTTSGPKGSVVTLTSDAAGTAGILQCRINGGINPQTGAAEAAYTKRAKWHVPTAGGLEVGCIDEAFESDPVYGTTGLINAAVRSVGGGSGVTSVSGTAPIVSSGGATPAISISAASGGAAGSMSAAHYTLVNGATSSATVSTLVKRDAAGRFKAVAGVDSDDVATVSQVSGGGWSTGVEIADFGVLTPQDIKGGGDGTYIIAGRSFTATNTTHAAYLQLDADGITGQANNGSGDVMLSIPWATLAPAATLADHDVLILARLVRSTYSGVDNSSGMNLCFGFEPFSAGSDGGSGLPSKALLATVDTQGGTGLRNITQNYNWGTGQTGVWTGGDAATDVWVALYVAAGGRRFWGAIAAGGSTAPDPSDMVQMMAGVSTADTTGASGAWTPSASHLRLRWSDGGGGSKWSLRALKVVYK